MTNDNARERRTDMQEFSEVVLVPVGPREVPAVTEFLRAYRGGAPGKVDIKEAGLYVDVPGQRRWFQNEVDPLRDALPYPLLTKLIGLMIDQPGRWVAKHEAEDPKDPHSRIQLRNELTALTKACLRIHNHRAWPFEWKKERGVFYYRMHPLMGEWWTGRNADLN